MKNTNIKVIAITVNYRQNQYTIDCINSLLNSDYPNLQIILVDNGPTEEGHQNLKDNLPSDERLVLCRLKDNKGYVGGVNHALKKGMELGTDYFIILNNDTVIHHGAITALLNGCIKYNDKVIVSGKVYHYHKINELQFVGYKWKNENLLDPTPIGVNEIDNGQYDKEEFRDMLDDIFWLFSEKIIKDIGFYSQYFWFNTEQRDFAMRAKKAGYQLLYTPKAKIWHKGSVSVGGRDGNPAYDYWYTQSSLIFSYLHLSKINFFYYYWKQRLSLARSHTKVFLSGKEKSTNLKCIQAKYAAFKYFSKWKKNKMSNSGFNPFLISK